MTQSKSKDTIIEILVFFMVCVFTEFSFDLIFDNLKYDDAATFIGAALGAMLWSTVFSGIALALRLLWTKERKLDFFLSALWVSCFLLDTIGFLFHTDFRLSPAILITLAFTVVGFPFCASRFKIASSSDKKQSSFVISQPMKKRLLVAIEILSMIILLMICEYLTVSQNIDFYLSSKSVRPPKGIGAYLGSILPSFIISVTLGLVTMGVRCFWNKKNKLNVFLTASWIWLLLIGYLFIALHPHLIDNSISVSFLPVLPILVGAFLFTFLRTKRSLFQLTNISPDVIDQSIPTQIEKTIDDQESRNLTESSAVEKENENVDSIEQTSPDSDSSDSNVDELKNLTNLLSKGLITEEEFIKLKSTLNQ